MTAEPANPLEARIARLEGSFEQIDRRLGALESRVDSGFADLRAEIRAGRGETDAKLDKLDARIDKLDSRIDRLDAKIERFDAKIDSRFNIVTFLGFFIAAIQLATAIGLFNRTAP